MFGIRGTHVRVILPVHSTAFSQVATVLDQLHKFLGPELKAVTGESAGIDEIMDRVEGLALPLNKVIFDYRRTMSSFCGGVELEATKSPRPGCVESNVSLPSYNTIAHLRELREHSARNSLIVFFSRGFCTQTKTQMNAPSFYGPLECSHPNTQMRVDCCRLSVARTTSSSRLGCRSHRGSPLSCEYHSRVNASRTVIYPRCVLNACVHEQNKRCPR